MTDHYATLEIPRDAGTDAIVRAWRSAASRHHPDKVTINPHEEAGHFHERVRQAADKFRAARAAFECLMDREKRAAYDAGLAGPTPDAPMVSMETYEAVANLRRGLVVGSACCPVCDNAREVRVPAEGGFWVRKQCPACGRA